MEEPRELEEFPDEEWDEDEEEWDDIGEMASMNQEKRGSNSQSVYTDSSNLCRKVST